MCGWVSHTQREKSERERERGLPCDETAPAVVLPGRLRRLREQTLMIHSLSVCVGGLPLHASERGRERERERERVCTPYVGTCARGYVCVGMLPLHASLLLLLLLLRGLSQCQRRRCGTVGNSNTVSSAAAGIARSAGAELAFVGEIQYTPPPAERLPYFGTARTSISVGPGGNLAGLVAQS